MPTRRLPMREASAAASSTTRRQRGASLGRHGRRRAGADQADDGFPRSAYVQAGTPEHAAGHALSLQQHAQQKVFRAHIAVPKLSR